MPLGDLGTDLNDELGELGDLGGDEHAAAQLLRLAPLGSLLRANPPPNPPPPPTPTPTP